MATKGHSGWQRLALAGGVYLSQGTIFGFASFVLIPALAARGESLYAQTSVLSLAALPWIIKLGWALAVDSRALARTSTRAIMAAATVVMALLVAAAAFVGDPLASLDTMAWLWFGINVAASLQDVATDALILDEVPDSQRGLAGGVTLGSHHVGSEGIGGLLLGAVVGAQGFSAALGCVAVGLAALAAVAFAARSAGGTTRKRRVDLSALHALLASRKTWLVGGFAAAVMTADVVTSAVSGQFLIGELGWTAERISGVLAPLLLVANVAGYVVAARISDRLGHVRALALGGVALGSLWLIFAGLAGLWPLAAFMYGFVTLQAMVTAVLYVGLHAWLMDSTEPRVRATHFAALTSLVNAPRVAIPLLGAPLVATLGFQGLYAACGATQVLLCAGLLVAQRLTDTQARR